MATMSVLSRLTAARFVASEADVEQLAAAVQSGTEANGAYMNVLLVECQARLGAPPVRGRRPVRPRAITMEDVVAVLDAAHLRFYPHVLAGVGPPDLDKAERARRATFARTAKSTLMSAIKAGVDLRQLDPMEVTKRALRRLAKGEDMPADEQGGAESRRADISLDNLRKTIQRGERMLLNALGLLVQHDRPSGVEVVARVANALDKLVPLEEAFEAAETAHVETIVGHTLQRQPAPLAPGAR